jgi:hypothetical protein
MNSTQYLNQWLKYHKAYENRAYKVFNNSLREVADKIPITFSYLTASASIKLNIGLNIQTIENSYIKVYSEIGLVHGKRVGAGINKDIKDFNRALFSDEFLNTIIQWVKENAGQRITSVSETLAKEIIKLVIQAQEQNLSIDEMQRFIRRSIDLPNFTRYQALRIARTETTAAANHAAMISGNSSGILLEKVWLSAQNERTRDGRPEDWNHLAMNEKRVGKNENFIMTSNKGVINEMEYPGDVTGSAGNVINCRCAFAWVPVLDGDGFAIRV